MAKTAPRRSGRERKTVNYTSPPGTLKRKRATGTDGEDSGSDLSDLPSDNDDDAPEDYAVPSTRKSRAKRSGPPPTKKARATKATAKVPRKPRAAKDATTQKSNISDDNPLFNAVLNPSAALQSTVEDFLQALEFNPNPTLAELINFVLRACGSNDSVDADKVVDSDGIVDALDHFTEALKHIDSPMYPLTSKLAPFKKFRKSLSEFLDRLVSSAAEMGPLWSTDLMDILKQWVIAMSSSQIRSFRHTATVIALEIETALCRVAASLEKESDRVGRQREGDKKRKANSKSAGAKGKDLESKAEQLRERRMQVAAMLKEFFNGVFIHRYRDTDHVIRADCVKSLGIWFQKFPSEFSTGDYLRYVGWVLSDGNATVRIEAIRALSGVYAQSEHATGLNHFTERFKPRLIQMANGDTELSIRVAVIQVLGAVEEQSLLDDEEREQLCSLVKDVEPKVRKAVAHFVRTAWDEMVETKLVEKSKPTDQDRERVGFKVFGTLLANLLRTPDSSEENPEPQSQSNDIAADKANTHAHSIYQPNQTNDIFLVVESLWGEFELLQDWEGLMDMLLLDHSAAEQESLTSSPRKGRKKANAKADTDESSVDDLWRLEDNEEGLLLEVLVCALRLAQLEAAGSKKDEPSKALNEMSRQLINALPRLFHKHQTDEHRISYVLRLPDLVNLDMYLDMRMLSNYTALWDDITKQFLSHSSIPVLTQAMTAIQRCMSATSLAKTNSEKITEMEDELSASLRDVIGGREEIDLATFTEDEILTLTSLSARISILASSRDMCGWIEEDEGGNQSSAWDILNALVDRGRLGHEDEVSLFEHTTNILGSYVSWKYRRLITAEDGDATLIQDTLIANRDMLYEKLSDFALGGQSNTLEAVKLTAFLHYLRLHTLFLPAEDPELVMSLDDEVQYRCAGFMQAEVERRCEILHDSTSQAHEQDAEEEDEDDEGSDIEEELSKKLHPRSPDLLAKDYSFMKVVVAFMACLFGGSIHPRHGAIFLPYYGRLGAPFDQACRKNLGLLREEGLTQDHPEILVEAVTQSMQEAFLLSLRFKTRDDSLASLCKLLVSHFTVRGTQLSVLKRLSSGHIAEIHIHLTDWLAEKLCASQEDEADRVFRRTTTFFRNLIPLVTGMDSKDALKVKAHLSQVLAEKKVEIPSSSKIGDSLRAYEKKLGSKEKAANDKPRKKPREEDDGLPTSDEESEAENMLDSGDEEARKPPPPRARTRAKPVTPKEHQPSVDPSDASNEPEEQPETPKAKGATPRSSSLQQVTPVSRNPSPRKRRRDGDSDNDAIDLDALDVPSREPTPAGDLIIPRRKRLRH